MAAHSLVPGCHFSASAQTKLGPAVFGRLLGLVPVGRGLVGPAEVLFVPPARSARRANSRRSWVIFSCAAVPLPVRSS
jgi:hypothetical protein